VAALDARELQLVQLCALLPLELGELLILGIELPLELGNALDVLLDQPDLRGARAAEVAVVGEDAAGERGVLLVEEQLQRLLPADGVGGAQLPGLVDALRQQLDIDVVIADPMARVKERRQSKRPGYDRLRAAAAVSIGLTLGAA